MTWAELHGVLRGRGLIRADDGLRADAAEGAVTGVTYDSRTVTTGQVFVALRGQHADGTAFARQAIERGAAAIVSEQAAPDGVHVPWAIVEDARLALAVLATAFYRDPSREMQVVGITGTNGKTTTAYLVASIFEAAGIRCGLLGTVAYRIGDEVREATRTTPEAPEVQALLREMVEQGCGACAMEVSSHALSLRRVDGMTFAAGVFTNLTRDHLDFHADMDDYFRAKRRLFEMLPRDAPSLVNLDDPRASALLDAGGRPVTYAIGRAADITPGPLSFSLEGLTFDVRTPRGTLQVRSTLVGRPNVYNILAAVSTATALDLPFDAIERGVQSLAGVPDASRWSPARRTKSPWSSTTPTPTTRCATCSRRARPLARGRLITVFGCGGDRDRTKRPLMGAVAGRPERSHRDHVGQPAQRRPGRIIEEIQRGITRRRSIRGRPDSVEGRDGGQRVVTIVDRRAAIAKAIELAGRAISCWWRARGTRSTR